MASAHWLIPPSSPDIFLALAHKPYQRRPVGHAHADLDQQLGFGRLDAALLFHVGRVPRPLCLVEHDDVVLRILLPESVCAYVRVQVADEDLAFQSVLQHLD